VAELTLLSPGDILFLYTDGVYDGSDKEERQQLENVIRDHQALSAKDICNALLEYAVKKMIICARLANKIASTIKQFSLSSGTEEGCDMAVVGTTRDFVTSYGPSSGIIDKASRRSVFRLTRRFAQRQAVLFKV